MLINNIEKSTLLLHVEYFLKCNKTENITELAGTPIQKVGNIIPYG